MVYMQVSTEHPVPPLAKAPQLLTVANRVSISISKDPEPRVIAAAPKAVIAKCAAPAVVLPAVPTQVLVSLAFLFERGSISSFPLSTLFPISSRNLLTATGACTAHTVTDRTTLTATAASVLLTTTTGHGSTGNFRGTP